MSEHILIFPKYDDVTWLTVAEELRKIVPEHRYTIQARLIDETNVQISPTPKEAENIIELIKSTNTTLISRIFLNIDGYQISLRRTITNKEKNSRLYDELLVPIINEPPKINETERIKILSFLIKELNVFDPEKFTSILPAEHSEALSMHQSVLDRLSKLNETLISNTDQYRKNLDTDFIEKEKLLEDKYHKVHAQYKNDHENKLLHIQQQQLDLDTLKQQLDDKSNTHARREIRRDILKEIKSRQEKFSLTKGTNSLRSPIALAMATLVILFIIGSVFSAIEFYEAFKGVDTTKIIVATIKQTIYSIGAVGSIIFYIRWMNRWFEQHAQAEFNLKQFELDMERASWLVETSLEWNDAKGTTIPSELLNALNKNLFSESRKEIESLVHPADQLASALLGSASSIKPKAGENMIEVDPKKLAKTNSTDSGT